MAKKTLLMANQYYHIYNRGNNRQVIFIENQNYSYFLGLVKKHISPIAKVYAYALLPNHFHLLVQIKNEAILARQNVKTARQISQKFGNCFNAYAKAINKKYNQVSSLFEDRFERNLIDSESYLFFCVQYLHWNPQKHNYVNDFSSWPHTSYNSFLSGKSTELEREEVLNWFNGVNAFEESHKSYLGTKEGREWSYKD